MTHTGSEEPLEPISEKKPSVKKGTVTDKARYLLGHARTYPIYVIGTGRSGTHWLGYSLKDHPEIRATFVQETDRVLAMLSRFLGLKAPLRKPEVKTETLHKWENQLSDEALQQIEDTVGFGPAPVTR